MKKNNSCFIVDYYWFLWISTDSFFDEQAFFAPIIKFIVD